MYAGRTPCVHPFFGILCPKLEAWGKGISIIDILSSEKSMPLSPTAQKVQDLLTSLGFTCQVIEFQESTRTAQEAADRAGCTLGQITKSLIFKGRTTGKPILVLTSGANRVDEKRFSEYAGEPIGRADADFVRTVTGFAIGGVPPLGHAQKMDTYIDQDLMQFNTIWAAAGTPNAIFELTPDSLQKMTDGKVVKVK
jgi:prolyl-tRNA editing enzyme YbaK/EbsC (Cys-tRNA(Pro) deacylase)